MKVVFYYVVVYLSWSEVLNVEPVRWYYGWFAARKGMPGDESLSLLF